MVYRPLKTKQPNGPSQTSAFVFKGVVYNPAFNGLMGGSNGPKLGTSDKGVVYSASAGSSATVQVVPNFASVLSDTSRCTVAILRRHKDTTARDSISYGYGDGTGANRVSISAPWSSGDVIWDYGSAFTRRLATPWGTKNTEWHTLVCVAGPNKGLEIWRNGIKLAGDASKVTGTPAPNGFPFLIGGFDGSVDDFTETALLVVDNAEWSDVAIQTWCKNPWKTFISPVVTSPFLVPSGSTTWIITPSGSITFSGTAPEIKTNVIEPAGSITFSGTAIPEHTKTYIPTGNITFSGNANQIKTKIELASGTITFSGSAPMAFIPFGSATYTTYLPLTGAGH